jgi:hypothetical protein
MNEFKLHLKTASLPQLRQEADGAGLGRCS